jgi:hypothetical protein
MKATTGRVVIGLAVAVCLLALGGLEVLSERVRVDGTPMTLVRPGDVERDPVWDTIAPPEAPDPALESAHLTMALQAGRRTVLDVDEKAGRLVSRDGTGHVLESELGRRAVVITDDKQLGPPALLKAGDVIRIEPAAGQVQKIVLLRHAWQQLEGPEQ